MKSHFYKQYLKAYLKDWNGYEACQTPGLCFCRLEGAQHSIAFLSFWSYWPIKHCINLFCHNFWTNNNVLCTIKDLATWTAVASVVFIFDICHLLYRPYIQLSLLFWLYQKETASNLFCFGAILFPHIGMKGSLYEINAFII